MIPIVPIFHLLFLLLTTIYVVQVFRFLRGIGKLQYGSNELQYTVSVLVPARNEEQNILACLSSLSDQDYPKHLYSITVIDDQSTDMTAALVEQFSKETDVRIHLHTITESTNSVSPKINALTKGIALTDGEIILTTDADCIVSQRWISTTVRHFTEHTGATTGVTHFIEQREIPRLLFGYQYIDFLSFTACGAGSIGYGTTTTTNGSNMAFRRKAFHDVGGYGDLGNLHSGDDSLLAQKIEKTNRWKVNFVLDPLSYVSTHPVRSWSAVLIQRMRWAAQTTSYPAGTVLFMIAAFLLYLLLVILLPASFYFNDPVPWYAFAAKCGIDLLVVNRFTSLTHTRTLLKYFIPSAVLHLYIVVIAVFGGYFTQFEWKDRKVGRKI